MVHFCPRCDLRFIATAELRSHLEQDHGVATEPMERLHYPVVHPEEPLYPATDDHHPRRYLIVADHTVDSQSLGTHLYELATAQPSEFFLLVPARHTADYPVTEHTFAGDTAPTPPDQVGLALAQERLRHMLEALKKSGIAVGGEVGDFDPFAAVLTAFGRQPYDEVILSALPATHAHWLDTDLRARIARKLDVPVHTLTDHDG